MSKRQHGRRARRVAIAAGTGAGAALVAAAPAAAQDFTVSNLANSGVGSLRQAVADADAVPGADRILFQSGLSGSIGLTTGGIDAYTSMQIVGPGSAELAIDGGGEDRLFNLGDPGAPATIGISGLTLRNGTRDVGGAIVSGNTDLTLEDSVVTGNQAGLGGAIYAAYGGSLTVRDATIDHNVGYGVGGAISVNNQDVLIQGSTFDRNRSGQLGGALALSYGESPRTVEIENSTLTRNGAGLFGGAIASIPADPQNPAEFDPTLEVRSSTISGNQAVGAGGGVAGGLPEVSIENSIVSGNSAFYGPDLYSGSFGSGPPPEPGCGCYDDTTFDTGFSLVEDPAQAVIDETVAGSNILNQDPELDSLADNGGPTRTLGFEADSPVVNKGSSPLTTDQRGDLRPVLYPGIANSAAAGANGADMGAFELQYTAPPPPPPPPVVNGPFKILGSTPKANGTAVVRVKVPAPGEVKLVGYKRLKTISKRANAKGVFKFRATPKGKLKRNLNKRGRARVLVKFHYNPDAGRTLDKGKVFPFYKGAKIRQAAVAAVRAWTPIGPWAGR